MASNRVGPLLLAHPIAREQFISTGEVVTFRAGDLRTTGDTHARWKRTGKGMADCHVSLIGPAAPSDDITPFVEHADRSGFRTPPRWLKAISESDGHGRPGEQPDGHLFRVEFQRAREPLKAWIRDEYGTVACDGCGEDVAPWVSDAGGSGSGESHRHITETVSWCAWDSAGIPPEDRPKGWRFALPEDGV